MGVYIFLAVGVVILVARDWPNFRRQVLEPVVEVFNTDANTVTAYAVYCDKTSEHGKCLGIWKPHSVRTYTIDYDNNYVISQVDGGRPFKLANCVLVNTNNWKCGGEGHGSPVGFASGKYFSDSDIIFWPKMVINYVTKREFYETSAAAQLSTR